MEICRRIDRFFIIVRGVFRRKYVVKIRIRIIKRIVSYFKGFWFF